MSLDGEISKRVCELAKLLVEAEKEESGTGARLLDGSLRELAPPASAILARAFEGGVRENILKGVLEACGEMEASGVRERISDSDLTAFILRLYRQMTAIEGAIVPIAAEIMKEAQKNKLPGHVANLKGYTLQLLRIGGMEAVDKINDYLGDINCWIAAILYGWTKAPEEWWLKWWEKLSPTNIERNAAANFLRNKYREYWKRYGESIRELNPIFVKSQINEISGDLARKKMKRGAGNG